MLHFQSSFCKFDCEGVVRMKYITVVILLFTLWNVDSAEAQSTVFGKNKVQYKDFDWYYIQSSHFDVYFNQGGEYLAEFTADVAESSYQSISKSFRYHITNRISIVVYNSHNEFQQTNVVSEYLEEGIGGVTELFKNRVVLPFEGDYGKFRHVIHHELVHAVINDMFYGGSLQSIISGNITLQLPLWFNEGIAEYEALRWDVNSDMFIRDAIISGYLPPIQYLNGYLAYRGGQSLWYYISQKYGEEKIGDILMRVKSTHSVDQGFRSAIGLDIEELSERWQKEQKVLYWPDIAKRDDPTDYARRLTNHTKDGSFYNTSPTISPQGDRIAFISNRDDYFDVFIMNTIDGTIEKKLIKGQRTADFEELHLLTPGMSWSPDGNRIALATKSGEHDAIIIVDVNSNDENKIAFELDGIFSVDWSPQGNKLAFVGNQNQQSDIYIYNLETHDLVNLTNDIFSDADPSWSADGKSVYFSSDRTDYLRREDIPASLKMQSYHNRQHDLYNVEVESGTVRRTTDFDHSDESSPVAAADGKHLLFISDRNGINNIYVKNLDSGTVRPLTNSLNGVYQLSLSRDGNKLAFASLINGGFDIFLMRTPLERKLKSDELELTEFFKDRLGKRPVSNVEEGTKDTIAISPNVVIKTSVDDSANVFEEKARADFRNYVFGEAFQQKKETEQDTARFTPTNSVDAQGKYIVYKYKLNFSPDIIYGNAGYNTFYGVTGSTVMAFSDMLGDHQIFLLTNLLFDLKNSDYALAYFYLPKRIDYGIQAFHSARFLYVVDSSGYESLFRFRNYGATSMASLPISKFNRVDFGLSWLTITRDDLDFPFDVEQKKTLVLPSLSYIHDNTLWGYIAPSNGDRYNLTFMASPKLGSNGLGFYSAIGDYRRYFKLWKNYTFAFRLAGGGSFGQHPQRFIIGGVDNWVNRQFEGNRIPVENAEDYVFLTSGIPLRGYNYNARIGTKYAMMNMEFRFPLFGYFVAGPLPVFFQSLNGVFFLDMGGAWTSTRDFKGMDRDQNGDMYLKDLLTGTGYGVRMIVLGFLLKMDVAWSFNFQSSSPPKYYFSLGADF
jgi:Tol biopolymer transport system component